MSTETLGYLDAIKHLPEGGTLHLQDVTWKEYEELVERRDEVSHVRLPQNSPRVFWLRLVCTVLIGGFMFALLRRRQALPWRGSPCTSRS